MNLKVQTLTNLNFEVHGHHEASTDDLKGKIIWDIDLDQDHVVILRKIVLVSSFELTPMVKKFPVTTWAARCRVHVLQAGNCRHLQY